MDKATLKFGKECAEILDWYQPWAFSKGLKLLVPRAHRHYPKGFTNGNDLFELENLEFHTKLDWSMVLALKLKDMGFEVRIALVNTASPYCEKESIYEVSIWEKSEVTLIYQDECEKYDDFPYLVSKTCLHAIKLIKEIANDD